MFFGVDQTKNKSMDILTKFRVFNVSRISEISNGLNVMQPSQPEGYKDFTFQNVQELIKIQKDRQVITNEVDRYVQMQQQEYESPFVLKSPLLEKWHRVQLQVKVIMIIICDFQRFLNDQEIDFRQYKKQSILKEESFEEMIHKIPFSQVKKLKAYERYKYVSYHFQNFLGIYMNVYVLFELYFIIYLPFVYTLRNYHIVYQGIDASMSAILLIHQTIKGIKKYLSRKSFKIDIKKLTVTEKAQIWFYILLQVNMSTPWVRVIHLVDSTSINVNYGLLLVAWLKVLVFIKFERNYDLPQIIFGKYAEKNIIKFLYKFYCMIMNIHIFSCLFYSLSVVRQMSDKTFFYNNITNPEDRYGYVAYIKSFYWMSQTWCTAGYGDMTNNPDTNELIYQIIFIIIGAILFTYYIAQLSNFFVSGDTKESILQTKVSTIDQFCQDNNIGADLCKKIINRLVFNSKQIFLCNYLSVKEFLEQFPINQKKNILLHIYPKLTKNIFFKDQRDTFITKIICLMTPQNFDRQEIIYEQGKFPNQIYFLMKGRVCCMDSYHSAFQFYVENSYFGEIEVLLNGIGKNYLMRIFQVSCLYPSETLIIQTKPFMKILKDYPFIHEHFQKISKFRYQKSMLMMRQHKFAAQIDPGSAFWMTTHLNFFEKVKQSTQQQSKTMLYIKNTFHQKKINKIQIQSRQDEEKIQEENENEIKSAMLNSKTIQQQTIQKLEDQIEQINYKLYKYKWDVNEIEEKIKKLITILERVKRS